MTPPSSEAGSYSNKAHTRVQLEGIPMKVHSQMHILGQSDLDH